jgi:hypothetical protein
MSRDFGIQMSIRLRKFIGTIALLVLLVVWTFMAMAASVFVAGWNSALASGLYYVFAGIGWVLPAMPLISWMSRPDAAKS